MLSVPVLAGAVQLKVTLVDVLGVAVRPVGAPAGVTVRTVCAAVADVVIARGVDDHVSAMYWVSELPELVYSSQPN